MFRTPNPVPVPVLGSAAVSTASRTSSAPTATCDRSLRSGCVLDRVGQRFLHDSVQSQAGSGGQPRDVPVHGERGVGAGGPEPLDQHRQAVGARQRRCPAGVTILMQHPDGQPNLVQARPAESLGLGQRTRGVVQVMLHGQPSAA